MEGKKLFGMPTRIIGGIAAIAVVAVLSAGATVAYFSGTEDQSATVATATIGVDSSGFPLSFSNMLPGDWQYSEFWMLNDSSAKADLYIQLIGSSTPPPENLCSPDELLSLWIEDLDLGGYKYQDSICRLYPGDLNSRIVKVADDVAAGGWRHYRVGLYLDPMTGNDFQNFSDTATVHLIAVQYNGPAPQPDQDSGGPWPADVAPDNDPNYP